MKKIRLDLDALDVQSFATTGAREPGRGTVHGAETDEVSWLETRDQSCRACESAGSGSCLGTRYDPECTDLGLCVLQPWTEGQDSCFCQDTLDC